jgi:hypothetical protein
MADIVPIDATPDDHALTRRLLFDIGYPVTTLFRTPIFIQRREILAIVARARVHGGRAAIAEAMAYRHCRVCGCTETTACHPPPCWWVENDLCSACQPFTEPT